MSILCILYVLYWYMCVRMQVYVFIHFSQSLFHITTTGIFCYLTLFSWSEFNSCVKMGWFFENSLQYNNHQDSSHCLIQLCIVIFGMYLKANFLAGMKHTAL